MNIRSVVKVLGFLMLVTAGCLLLPALVSLLYRENDWIWFVASSGIGAAMIARGEAFGTGVVAPELAFDPEKVFAQLEERRIFVHETIY